MLSGYNLNVPTQEVDYVRHDVDFYKRRAKYYDHGFLGAKIPETLRKIALEMSEVKPGETVLDVCTGTGKAATWFFKAGAKVTGIDISQDMISIARAKHPEITFRVMNASRLEFPDKSYDVVNVQMGLHDMPVAVIRKVLVEMARVAQRTVIIAEPQAPKNSFLRVIFRCLLFSEFFEASDWKGYTNLDLKKEIQDSGMYIEKEKSLTGGLLRIYMCRL